MMKRQIILLYTLILTIGIGFMSCEPEEFELGAPLSKDQLSYSIEQNPGDLNMVILQSLTAAATPMWVTPMGRSTKVIDTVRLAFPGEYKFVYGVQSPGGFVQADTVTLNITTTNLSYVDDPLWNMLTGGVGEEKTWYLDLDAEATSKYFAGPLYFYGTDNGWQGECYGEDCWNWNPDYAGNSWLMAAGDYGSMTFSLKGNALLTANHQMLGRNESGTFFLDVDAKRLSTTDAYILHDSGRDGQVVNWGDLVIFSLTENTMQLGALRDEALSGEGPAMLVYNFISKEYADNWVPEEEGDPDIDVDLGGAGSIGDLVSLTTTKTWSLSPETPFNWTDLEGNFLNPWESISDYPDWAGYDAADASAVASSQIKFSSNGTVILVDADGNESEGSYSTEEGTNLITFDGVTPSFPIGDWVVATTTEANQWKIVKTLVQGGIATDIWFGKRDPLKSEYMVFHFVLGSSDVDPLEEARKQIIAALTGPTGTRSFRVSDTWHVDWLDQNLNGGWTTATTFADDFTSNSWVWTAAVKAGLQEPRLTFTKDGSTVTATRTQNGETTSAEVIIDPENNAITIDMNLIEFTDAASWLPSYGPTWRFCKVPLTSVETSGMWLGVPSPGKEDTETIAIHYVIAE